LQHKDTLNKHKLETDMKAKLNSMEAQVFEACKKAEGQEIEEEVWFECIDRKTLGLTVNQLKGYISSLIRKGWLRQVGFEPTYHIA
jgi:ribonucleotide reductase beta subunit family protein with ferritin-like domain